MVVFGLGLTTFVTGALTRRFKSRWFDDVCNGYCPRVPVDWPSHRPRAPPPGPVGQAARLPETPVSFARSCLWWVETAIAFAGEKWAFLVQFSGAEVMPVSTSPCCRASCAKKFALRGLMVGVSAKKFALHAQNTPKSAFYGVLGELIRGRSAAEAVLGEFFRGRAAGGAVLGEFFRGRSAVGSVLGELFRGRAAGGAVLGELIRGGAAGGAVLGELIRGRAAGGVVLGELIRGPAVVGSRGASCVAPRPW